jgi:1,2-dihydroxy-3-keto-5-methylthiopentene dioxygenase
MRAYPLDDPTRPISPDDLARRGILSWTIPSEGAQRDAVVADLKRERGYVDEDFVELKPDLPNLGEICAKFDKEHFHTEDEVRFVVDGEGIFDVRDESDQWMRIEVTPGDAIVIPARMHHRFMLTDRKHIRCMRLFANHDGWAPLYR